MNVRQADDADIETIRDIAQQSMRASYAVSPATLDTIVEERFDTDAVRDRLDERTVAVAEANDSVVGFVEGGVVDGVGELHWLHVHPEQRGRGAGTALFEWARDMLRERGASDVHALVLDANSEGDEFFERFGYERIDHRDFGLSGETLREHVYAVVSDTEGSSPTAEPEDIPATVSVDGRELFVDGENAIPGDESPFHTVYEDEGFDTLYGYLCSNCGSMVEAVDELGRIECTECGNVHRPDEWDDAYL